MTNLWKTLRETLWTSCGIGVEKSVEKCVCGDRRGFWCEKLLRLEEKGLLFVNNKWAFGGKQRQRGKGKIFALSTVST